MTQKETLPLEAFCCRNKRCRDYGKKGLGNLYQHGWSNQKETIRLLRCRRCRKKFSERKGTPLHNAKITVEEAMTIAQHLAEGDGIRKTSRLTGYSQETVMRWNRELGEHGKALHEEQIRHVPVKEAQGDEMWSFVGKKRKAVRPERRR